MDFSLTEEQQLLRDAIARFVANEYSFEERKGIVASPKGWSDKVWSKFAEMGLLGVPFQEANGGFGGGGVDLMVVAQELGRGMVVEPYLSAVVLAGGLVEVAGTAAQKRDILPGIIKGKWLLALAHVEPQSRYDLHDVAASARREPSGYVLNGRKAVVLHGASADTLVVSARTAEAQRDRAGITLFLVDGKTRGVNVSGYRTIDGLRGADIELDGVHVGDDAVLDVEGARAAGMRAIHVHARAGAASVADAVISTLRDLPAAVASLDDN